MKDDNTAIDPEINFVNSYSKKLFDSCGIIDPNFVDHHRIIKNIEKPLKLLLQNFIQKYKTLNTPKNNCIYDFLNKNHVTDSYIRELSKAILAISNDCREVLTIVTESRLKLVKLHLHDILWLTASRIDKSEYCDAH